MIWLASSFQLQDNSIPHFKLEIITSYRFLLESDAILIGICLDCLDRLKSTFRNQEQPQVGSFCALLAA
jgi:hypothetical protein